MEELVLQIQSIIDKDLPLITNLSNTSAVLNNLENINWCGFYLVDNGRLILGPFQGEVACTIIPFSKGVCGKCYRDKKTIIVPDVNKFPGHIACSSLSKSEIVIPLRKDGKIIGVLDIDSPVFDRFKEEDTKLLKEAARIIESKL